MTVEIYFGPLNDKDTAALTLLGVHQDAKGSFRIFGDPERILRILSAVIDVLKLSIVP